ncbi:MAG: FAD-dependent monooxygenase [Streptosporangiaceae bacterium]|nr:FAD-dependent monooxygenase [Streptosporangiaceae bacterium]
MPAPEPGPGPIAPHRTVLDPILLTAAAQAGAKVEMGVSVHGLLRQDGRVTGVTTSAGQRRARLVIGADGRNSRIARLAGAKTYHDHPPVTFAYYTYWRGCPAAGVHAWLEPGRFFGIFPVGAGSRWPSCKDRAASTPRSAATLARPTSASCGRVPRWPPCSGGRSSRSSCAARRPCPRSSGYRRGRAGRWPVTQATTKTPSLPGVSPMPSATRTCWPRPSLTAGTATWKWRWPGTGISAIVAPSR